MKLEDLVFIFVFVPIVFLVFTDDSDKNERS